MHSVFVEICHEALRLSKLFSLYRTWRKSKLRLGPVACCLFEPDVFFVDAREDKWHAGKTTCDILLCGGIVCQ